MAMYRYKSMAKLKSSFDSVESITVGRIIFEGKKFRGFCGYLSKPRKL